MKRLSVILVVVLVAGLFSGCRFAIVESDAVRVSLSSALAEGEDLFIVDEPDLTPMYQLQAAEAATAAMAEAEAEEKADEEAVRSAQARDDGYIGLNSRDEDGEDGVRRVQEALNRMGYLEVEPDGVFGSRTLKALRRFQRDSGLEQTGVLDEATDAALFPRPEVTTAPDDVLFTPGDSGSDIATLQRRLRLYGFATRVANGNYDEATAEAVMAFQVYAVENLGAGFDEPLELEPAVAPMGVWPPEPTPEASPTPEPAETSLPELPAPEPAATLRPRHAVDDVVSKDLFAYLTSDRFPVYRATVQRGDAGAEVERVQKRLATLNYYYGQIRGEFDEDTIQSLKLFQERNSLQQTGIADPETQRLLFSADAVAAESVDQPFYIKVSLQDQRVYVYRWEDGDYSRLYRTMICSTGVGNTTPKGVFISPGHRDARWHYFAEFHCWAQYAFIIKGDILFHSVIYSRKSESSLRQSTVRALGHKASHGCVRLEVEDARWIYEHCGEGQVIEIY